MRCEQRADQPSDVVHVVSVSAVCRYEPVSKKLFGVVMLRDLQPGTEAELVKVCSVVGSLELHLFVHARANADIPFSQVEIPATAAPPKEEEEPPAPEPFEYIEE